MHAIANDKELAKRCNDVLEMVNERHEQWVQEIKDALLHRQSTPIQIREPRMSKEARQFTEIRRQKLQSKVVPVKKNRTFLL
jgi:hypothetical protein